VRGRADREQERESGAREREKRLKISILIPKIMRSSGIRG